MMRHRDGIAAGPLTTRNKALPVQMCIAGHTGRRRSMPALPRFKLENTCLTADLSLSSQQCSYDVASYQERAAAALIISSCLLVQVGIGAYVQAAGKARWLLHCSGWQTPVSVSLVSSH